MEIILGLLIVGLFCWVILALSIESENMPIAVFCFILAVSLSVVWITNTEELVETTELHTLTLNSGIEVKGYFEDATTFIIIPNHIETVEKIHPRLGSIHNIKFEYK